MESVSIKYRITEPEFMSACNCHWLAHKQGTKGNIILGVSTIVIGLIIGFNFGFGFFLAIAGVVLILIVYIRSLLWRKAFRDAKKFKDDIFVTFSDDVMHVETAEGKSDLNWSYFSWYLDTTNYVLIYVTKKSFSIIPKAAFQNEKCVQQFLDIIKSKLKKK